MTAHTSNGRGTLVVKRSFRGLTKPIRVATGTLDTKVADQIDLMYSALYAQGRLDLLEAIAYGRLHPMKALSQWRQGRELEMPTVDLMPSAVEAWLAWEEAVPGEDHRSSIGTTRRALRIPERASIEVVPDLLATYATRAADRVRSVNLARAHVRAFLRDTVGQSHPLYLRVKDMRPLKRKPRERGTPHPLADILALAAQLDVVEPGAGGMALTMAVTGMGNKEYWHDGFRELPDRVEIYGKKRDGRTREVPSWYPAPLVTPVCWEGRFRSLLREASGGAVAIYDLRRSFARWCEEAGIIESNRDAYLGHGPRTMTQLYTFGQLPGQLEHDADLLRKYHEKHAVAGALV